VSAPLTSLIPDGTGRRLGLGKNIPEGLSKEWDVQEQRMRACTNLEDLLGVMHEYLLRSAARLANLEAHVAALESAPVDSKHDGA